MSKSVKSNKNKNENWYSIVPKHMLVNVPNDHYDDHLITLPCRIILVGCSGAGKTQNILSIIYRMKNTFTHIYLCCMNAAEPLYKFLASKLDREDLTVCEGVDNIIGYDDIEDDNVENPHTLVIYDDLCLTKNQSKISDLFIRGRKKPASILYATQSYFQVPKVCRLNSTHIILKKLSTLRDLRMILSDFTLNVTKEELLELYQKCTKEKDSFLLIDVAGPPETRFRYNFTENITPPITPPT